MKVRTRFQPREELEVSDSEVAVLRTQGLLWEGTDEELHALLGADPVGPLDPRQSFDAPRAEPAAPPAPAAKPAPGPAPTPVKEP